MSLLREEISAEKRLLDKQQKSAGACNASTLALRYRQLVKKVKLLSFLQERGIELIVVLDLNSPSVAVRISATRKLRYTKDEEVQHALVERMLRDKNSLVRRHTAEALQGSKHERVVERIADEGLSSRDPRVRRAAAVALRGVEDTQALGLLCEVGLSDTDTVRSEVIETLSACQNYAVWRRLVEEVSGTAGVMPRGSAACVVRSCPYPELIEAVLRGLHDPNFEVRAASTSALRGATNEKALRLLCTVSMRDEVLEVREKAAESLIGVTHEPTLRWLTRELRSLRESRRYVACLALTGTSYEPARKRMCRLNLRSRFSNRERCAAAEALKGIRDGALAEEFAKRGIRDRVANVRAATVRSLWRVREIQVQRLLCEYGLTDEYSDVRTATVQVLGRSPHPEIHEAIANVLNDPVHQVSEAARKVVRKRARLT